MSFGPADAASRLLTLAEEQGFALAGVCDLGDSEFAPQFDAWIESGKHGSMDWLARHRDIRTRPSRFLDGAAHALVVADVYRSRSSAPESDPPPGRGRVAKYARGRDYHRLMKKRLHAICDLARESFPGAEFRAFVDTAPMPERELARRAGIGWIGKHTLLIHPREGSYLLLGGIATTLALRRPSDQPAVADHCGTCTRCIDACPTDAITPYSVDARRCISYLTIERRAEISPQFFEDMGQWLFGCDICQDVCPHNSGRAGTLPAHRDYAGADGFDLLDVLGWSAEERQSRLQGSAMKRARLDMLRRNATILAANSLRRTDSPALRERIDQMASGDAEPTMVRETALAVIQGLDRA